MRFEAPLLRGLGGLGGAGLQWLHIREKDLLWLTRGRAQEEALRELQERHEWVMIVGCNNSGTTLLHDVLAASGRFSYMEHEGQRYTRAIPPARRKGHERVWTEHIEDLRLDETDSLSSVPRLVFDWSMELSTPIKPRILEKTPANAVRMRWLQRAFPRSSFIGIVRNGYAVAEGIKRKGGKDVRRGARHWRCVNEVMLNDARHLRRFLLVRYEDFVQRRYETLERIAGFLGVPVADLEQGFARVDAKLAGGSGRGIEDMNERCIERLSREELRIITAEAGDLLRQFGYACHA